MRTARLLSYVALAAAAGLIAFGLMAWRSVTVERAEADEALRRFVEIRSQFAGAEPIVHVDLDGRVVRRTVPHNETASSKRLRALAYRQFERRLVQADVPFWFLRVKGPAVEYSLRGTGLDLKRLGVTPADLQRCGPCLVLDETRTNGDRLLVWTE